jgi:hypothetical protein
MVLSRCSRPLAAASRSSSAPSRTLPCRRARGRRDLHRHRDRPQARRSGRLRRPSAPLGRRELLRVAQPQPPAREGLRDHGRIRHRLPLRCISNAAYPPHGSLRMSSWLVAYEFKVGLLGAAVSAGVRRIRPKFHARWPRRKPTDGDQLGRARNLARSTDSNQRRVADSGRATIDVRPPNLHRQKSASRPNVVHPI